MSHRSVVVRLGALGDVLLTTGVLDYWNRTRGLSFHVVTRSCFAEVFKHHPAVESTVSIPPEKLTSKGWWDICRSLDNKYASLDLIDLHGSLRTIFLRGIWKGRVRTYPKMALQRRLYSLIRLEHIKKQLLHKNVPQRYALALSSEIPEQQIVRPLLFLTSEEILSARSTLDMMGMDRLTVCLHPYATHHAKTWPREKWKQFIKILEKEGYGWIIIGQDKYPLYPSHPRDLTGKTSIRQTGALISICKALVTGDSGPMHLGTATGTPTVGLFGPTSREWGFCPTGPQDMIVEPDLSCRPCSLHGRPSRTCRAGCMDMIAPEKVAGILMGLNERMILPRLKKTGH